MFFNTEADEIDPSIYRYIEGEKNFVNAGKLSELLINEVKFHRQVMHDQDQRKKNTKGTDRL